MLTFLIDDIDYRHAVTVEITGAFMQADMEGDTVQMNTEGNMVEIIIKIYPNIYRNYIPTEKGKSFLYVQFKRVLYGTLQADLLFWRILTSILQE